MYSNKINVCCRNTSGHAGRAAASKPFGRRQRDDAQSATVAVPQEPVHRPAAVRTPSADDDQPFADAHAADESQVAGGVRGRRRTTAAVVFVAGHAAGPEQHVERGRRPAPGGQAAAAAVAGNVLPTGGRHHQPVRRDGAEPAERLEARLADRHPDTGARSKVLSVLRRSIVPRLNITTVVVVVLTHRSRCMQYRCNLQP